VVRIGVVVVVMVMMMGKEGFGLFLSIVTTYIMDGSKAPRVVER
jgi:hypothetical protein